MNPNLSTNYDKIAAIIDYIKTDLKSPSNFDEISKKINSSPFNIEQLFDEWAGISSEKFIQYISIAHVKQLLKQNEVSIFDAPLIKGLSGTNDLHKLIINLEPMSPHDYKNGGQNLRIHYSFSECQFGSLLIASTHIGICYLAFYTNTDIAFANLNARFPNATCNQKTDTTQKHTLSIFSENCSALGIIKLHVKGSCFELKVWERLLKLPMGQLASYGNIALQIGQPKASRAVGTAIGKNPIAFLIPCHRVIQANGHLGGYRWGTTRKTAIIAWESAKSNNRI